jgi:hypothetical protein
MGREALDNRLHEAHRVRAQARLASPFVASASTIWCLDRASSDHGMVAPDQFLRPTAGTQRRRDDYLRSDDMV